MTGDGAHRAPLQQTAPRHPG